jgi:hypothetical protein
VPHEILFAEVARPDSVCVLKLSLLPFSLGHEIILTKERNPLLFDENSFNALPGEQQRLSIIRAALVCARTWKENDEPPSNLAKWFRLLGKPILSIGNRALIKNWRPQPDYPLEIATFRNYLAQSNTALKVLSPLDPEDVRTDEIVSEANGYTPMSKMRGRSFGAPLNARLLHFVSQDRLFASYGFETPFDFPRGLALNLYTVASELDGGMRIENYEETDERDNWRKILEETRLEEQREARSKPSPFNLQPSTLNEGLATPPPSLDAHIESPDAPKGVS